MPRLILIGAMLFGVASAQSWAAEVQDKVTLDVRFECLDSNTPVISISMKNGSTQDIDLSVDQLPFSTSGRAMAFEFNHQGGDSLPLFEKSEGGVDQGLIHVPSGGTVKGAVPLTNKEFLQSIAAGPTFVTWDYSSTALNVDGRTGGVYLTSAILGKCTKQR